MVKVLTYTYTYDIINISNEGGKPMGKRKDKKSLKIWDLVIKSLIAIAALITSIAELIKALT